MTSDWDCLRLARTGDETAWRILLDRHQQKLMKTACLLTGSLESAKDIIQESLYRLLRKEPAHTEGSFPAYAATIVYRLALKEKKRAARHPQLNTDYQEEHSPSPLEAVLTLEKNRLLAGVIESLDDHHRNILVLRFYGSLTYEEIAEITEVPIGTVKSRLFHAVKNCRKKLSEKGIIE